MQREASRRRQVATQNHRKGGARSRRGNHEFVGRGVHLADVALDGSVDHLHILRTQIHRLRLLLLRRIHREEAERHLHVSGRSVERGTDLRSQNLTCVRCGEGRRFPKRNRHRLLPCSRSVSDRACSLALQTLNKELHVRLLRNGNLREGRTCVLLSRSLDFHTTHDTFFPTRTKHFPCNPGTRNSQDPTQSSHPLQRSFTRFKPTCRRRDEDQSN